MSVHVQCRCSHHRSNYIVHEADVKQTMPEQVLETEDLRKWGEVRAGRAYTSWTQHHTYHVANSSTDFGTFWNFFFLINFKL